MNTLFTYECFQKWRIQNLWSHACCISANHTPNHAPESYPRIIPRIIPIYTVGSAKHTPETYPRNIPPKHTSNHTPWCNTLCWARSFRKGPYIHICICTDLTSYSYVDNILLIPLTSKNILNIPVSICFQVTCFLQAAEYCLHQSEIRRVVDVGTWGWMAWWLMTWS